MLNIYKIINTVNDKVYIGQTSETIEDRFSRHTGYQAREYEDKIHRAMRKYGIDKFSILKIDEATTQKELDDKEVYWINQYDSINKGYNTAIGGKRSGGDTLSNHPRKKEIAAKISKKFQGGGNPHAVRIKAINIIDPDKNKEYDSMMDCQNELHIDRHDIISRRCRGKIKKPYNKEWLFEYIE